MGYETVSSPGRTTRSLVASAVAAALIGAVPAANAGIELGEGLSVTGFVDMSLVSNDSDGESASFDMDQVEVDFMYAGSAGVSAQVDIEYGEDGSEGGGDTTFVEQAFITKKFTDQFSMKVGRFLSYSGWETEEPTGLFQYSGVGYAPAFYGYYQQGISAAYNGEKFAIMGSLVNDVFGWAGGPNESDTDDLGYEVGVAVMPVEGLTAKLFYMSDKKTDRDVINFWASYAVNGFTFAGEYNDADYADGGEGGPSSGDGFLLMANYASGPAGITVRYHDWDVNDPLYLGSTKQKGFTISPSYKVGDNLLVVAEFRSDQVSGGDDYKTVALEALFTF